MSITLDRLTKTSPNAFYVFDIPKLRARIGFLKSRLPSDVSLCYAVKANTFVIREIADVVDRFEICSPGEEHICEKLGVPAGQMVISGVYKTPEFIEKLISSHDPDRVYTVESLNQFDLIRNLSEKAGCSVPVLLRLTNDSQFGINREDIENIVKNREEYKSLELRGIQFFSGTQKTSVKKLAREIRHLDEFLCSLRDNFGYSAPELEYGTGFPVSYFSESEDNENELLDGFAEFISSMSFKTKIVIELGRSIAASCGRYFTRVVDLKCNKGQNYAIVDGGMHHIVYFGQHMAMWHPLMSLWGNDGEPEAEYNICGSLCSMNDVIVKSAPLPELSVGDMLCFENVGAYSMTEGISLFLSRDIPAIYFSDGDDELRLVRSAVQTAPLNTPNYEI